MAKHSLNVQIAEVKREIAFRTNVYPGLVTKGKMRQGEADEHMARMQSVQATLEFMAEHEDTIREAIAAKKKAAT